MIVVTAANGRLARRITTLLAQGGHEVLALVRGPGTELPEHVPTRVCDLDNPTSLAGAFERAETAYLVSPAAPQQLDRECRAIDEAIAQGIRRIIKISVLGASREAAFRFGRAHGQIEEHLRATSVDWTIVRPNRYFENLLAGPAAVTAAGLFHGSYGHGAISMMAIDDVARGCSRVVDHESSVGRTYTLTGCEALSGPQTAAVLASVLDRSVRYVDLSDDGLRRALQAAGLTPWFVESLVELSSSYRMGGAAEVTADFEDLAGDAPLVFKKWCQNRVSSFASPTGASD